jgi:hypothetical protein
MAQALGTDDSITACDCCGKSGLKLTVLIQLDCGDVVNYGTTCASRNTGKPSKQIKAEIRTEAKRVRDAAAAEYKASAEFQALAAKLQSRPRNLIGRAALEYILAEDAADTEARCLIAAKYGLKSYEVCA